jgi:hypothetical protein
VFVQGFWDVPLESRGVLFAPVVFSRTLLARRGWSYVPRWTVAAPTLLSSLWVRPGLGCYAFGDYYGARYTRLGFHPWFNWAGRVRDPLFNWYRAANRRNPGWERGLAATYRGRIAGRVALPPRTLAAQRIATGPRVLRPLGSFRSPAFRMTRLTSAQRAVFARGVSSFRNVGVSRFRSETRVGGVARGSFVRNVPGVGFGRGVRAGAVAGGGRRFGSAGGSARFASRSSGYRTTTGFRVGSTSREGSFARGSVARGGSFAHGSVTRGSAARATTSRSSFHSSSGGSFHGRAATTRSSVARSSSHHASVAHRSVTRGASAHTATRRSSTGVRRSGSVHKNHR